MDECIKESKLIPLKEYNINLPHIKGHRGHEEAKEEEEPIKGG